jgi:hypothetical protein
MWSGRKIALPVVTEGAYRPACSCSFPGLPLESACLRIGQLKEGLGHRQRNEAATTAFYSLCCGVV